MRTYQSIHVLIGGAYAGRALRSVLSWAGLQTPGDLTGMYLRGESDQYIAAACLAIAAGPGA